MKEELIGFAIELHILFTKGKSLREISQWSYRERELGRNVPYMSIADTQNKIVTRLWAQPTNKQKELKKFFDETVGISLPRFTLSIDDTGVHFREKLEKTEGDRKFPFIELI